MQQPATNPIPQQAAMDPYYQQQQQQWMLQQQQNYQQQPPPQPQHYQQAPPPQYQQAPPQQQVAPPAPHMYYGYQQVPAAAAAVAQPQQQPASADEVRTLWIGDLQYGMEEQYLISCFAQSGEVLSAKVIRNKQTGQSEGYGFVEFVSRAAAERHLQAYNGTLMPNSEQPFRMNWASFGVGEKRPDDAAEHTIFVGDLAAEVTDYVLMETFRPLYPSVRGAKVVTDRLTGRSKGYGFVKFGDENEQMHAMSEMNGRLCSTRPMRIGPAASKKNMDSQQQYPKAPYQNTQGEDDPNNRTIFVGGIGSYATEEELRQVFGQYGQVVHAKIPVGKRIAFVQFAERSSAEEALRMLQGAKIGGESVRLSWGHNKKPQAEQSQQNGGYFGYGQQYDTYGYAPPQDPNMYYGGYPAAYGGGAYPQQVPQQPQQHQ